MGKTSTPRMGHSPAKQRANHEDIDWSKKPDKDPKKSK